VDVGILIRGQSNAGYFMYYGAAEEVRREVQQDLGFDGIKNRVLLLGALKKTVVSATHLVCPADRCAAGDAPWMHGSPGPAWAPGPLETGLLRYVSGKRITPSAPVVLTLWLHNESDVYDRGLTAAEWTSAVRAEARLTRSALGADPIHAPYMFVWVPSAFGLASARSKDVRASAQAIKSAMEVLEHDPTFAAVAGPQTGDLDMSNDFPGYGYIHMTRADTLYLVDRMANCAANVLQPYAQPGSVVARHLLDCHGPVAEQAMLDQQHPEDVTVAFHVEHSTYIQAAGSAASHGAGWSAVSPDGTESLDATSAQVVSSSRVEVAFPKPLAVGWRIYYGYGVGRIAHDNGPGEGSALYDSAGIPMTAPSEGLVVGPFGSNGLAVSKTGYDLRANPIGQ
jgi:hypothetical protein